MPRKRVGRPRKRQNGQGIRDVIRSVHNFVKKNKLISKAANVLGSLGVPHAGTIGSIASTAGYRKKRRYRKRR